MAKGRSNTTLYEIASELRIVHAYCDMSNEDRLHHEILDPQLLQIRMIEGSFTLTRALRELRRAAMLRETYWIGELMRLNVWPCLFVLGGEHAETFSRRARKILNRKVLKTTEWPPNYAFKPTTEQALRLIYLSRRGGLTRR